MPGCESCLSSVPCSCKSSSVEQSSNIKNMTPNRQGKKTPMERHLYIRITPEKRRSLRVLRQNNVSSPLQTISENSSQMESSDMSRELSTPLKGYSQPLTNPFDTQADSLHLTSLSPSVFATLHTKETPEGKSFRWSIDQLAVLKPVDIDENSQQDVWNPEIDRKAQEAINAFFSKGLIVPSPWGPTTNHVTNFSPNLASTAYFPANEESDELVKVGPCATKASVKDVCTQTMLTIPPGMDLMSLLGRFCTYQADQGRNDSSDSSSDGGIFSTSLRRKLFVNEDDDNSSSRVDDEVSVPKESPKPAVSNKVEDWFTPGSDQFSSSPITPRNCSAFSNCSGRSISSPSVSPIYLSSPKSQRTGFGLRLLRRRTGFSWRNKLISEQWQCSPDLKANERKKVEKHSPVKDEDHRTPVFVDKVEKAVSHGDMEHCNLTQEMISHSDSTEVGDNPAFNITDSCSQQQDTGYQTSSLNSMASLLSSTSNAHFRVTPVTEILDSCTVSHPNIHCEELAISSMSLDQSAYFAEDSVLSEMAVSHENHDKNSNIPICFDSLKWKHNVCSTPTKNMPYQECS